MFEYNLSFIVLFKKADFTSYNKTIDLNIISLVAIFKLRIDENITKPSFDDYL